MNHKKIYTKLVRTWQEYSQTKTKKQITFLKEIIRIGKNKKKTFTFCMVYKQRLLFNNIINYYKRFSLTIY